MQTEIRGRRRRTLYDGPALSVKMTAAMRASLDAVADAAEWSLGDVVRDAIERGLPLVRDSIRRKRRQSRRQGGRAMRREPLTIPLHCGCPARVEWRGDVLHLVAGDRPLGQSVVATVLKITRDRVTCPKCKRSPKRRPGVKRKQPARHPIQASLFATGATGAP